MQAKQYRLPAKRRSARQVGARRMTYRLVRDYVRAQAHLAERALANDLAQLIVADNLARLVRRSRRRTFRRHAHVGDDRCSSNVAAHESVSDRQGPTELV